jgi:hypothetical protein
MVTWGLVSAAPGSSDRPQATSSKARTIKLINTFFIGDLSSSLKPQVLAINYAGGFNWHGQFRHPACIRPAGSTR